MTHVRRSFVDYVAYGLRVRSSVPLRFTSLRMRAAVTPDVTVRFGAVPAALRSPLYVRRHPREDMEWEVAPGVLLLRMRGVARYLVMKGGDVLVEPCGGDDCEIGEIFVETTWAAVLLQRNIIPFHASAVAFERGAGLFLGLSGAGKSSLVGALLKRGHAMLADDVVGVTLAADFRVLALPAYPRLRLCEDVLDTLDWRRHGQGRQCAKYSLTPRRFHTSPLPICAIYLLSSHNRSGIEIETVRGSSAMKSLGLGAWRGRLVHGLARLEHFRCVAAMVRQVPIARVVRPVRPLHLDILADRIEAHVRDVCSGASSRLVSRVPRRSRCDAGFHHGLFGDMNR